MKIKVYMQTVQEKNVLYVNDAKRDYVLLNAKETSFDADEFIFAICTMVKEWPNELKNDEITDGLKYRIEIKNGEVEKTYSFENKFPKDIYKLRHLINDVLSEVKHVE